MNAQSESSPRLITLSLFYQNAGLMIEDNGGYKIEYSVSYLNINFADDLLVRYLHREEDEVYKESCGRLLKLNLFPTKVDKSKCRPEYIRLSETITGIRVQKVILSNDIKLELDILLSLKELKSKCNDKLKSEERRTMILENEMLKLYRHYRFIDKSYNKLSSLLGLPIGWNFIRNCIFIELKRSEHSHDHANIQHLERVWDIQQYWCLFRSAELISRLGVDAYHVAFEYVSSLHPAASNHSKRRRGSANPHDPTDAVSFLADLELPICDPASLLDFLSLDSLHPMNLARALVSCATSHPLVEVISVVAKESIKAYAKELTHLDYISIPLAEAIVQALNDMSQNIEIVLESTVRANSLWSNLLNDFRRDRVKREKGKIVIRDGAEVEVDANGVMFVMPTSDPLIDTDVLHDSMQRLDVNICLAAVEERRAAVSKKLRALNGEMACLIQFGYYLTVVCLQRVWRGSIGSCKALVVRQRVMLLIMQAAAVEIQSFCRMIQCRKTYTSMLLNHREKTALKSAITIQKRIRGWTKWHIYQRHMFDKLTRIMNEAATLFQALGRGYLARKLHKKQLKELSQSRRVLEETWAAMCIQKMVRGMLSRQGLIKSLITRKRLDPRLLCLTEKYLQKGDLWKFLEEIGAEMNILRAKVKENQDIEDEMAETFVNKVIVRRKNNFDSAWHQFSENIANITKGDDGDELEYLTAVNTSSREESLQSLSAEMNSSKKQNQSKKVKTRSNMRKIPGPLLRRAITATISNQISKTAEIARNSTARSVVSIKSISKAYKTTDKTVIMSESSEVQPSVSKTTPVKTAVPDWLSTVVKTADEFKSPRSQYSTPTKPPSCRRTKKWRLPSGSTLPPLADVGDSILVDIPYGLDDKVERLLRAAALRSFVPSFFKGAGDGDAFEIYSRLPKSLVKVRFEQEAMKYCQPVVNSLKQSGIKYIFELLPSSKLKLILNSMGAEDILIKNCEKIVLSLRSMRSVSLGKKHIISSIECEAVSKEHHENGSKIPRRVTIASDTSNLNNETFAKATPLVDETSVHKMLDSLLENGSWNSLAADASELIIFAAFIVCADSSDDSTMGQTAFFNHARLILSTESEGDVRFGIKKRYRLALQLSAPYITVLKQRHCNTVRDLAAINLSELDMPVELLDQVEAMLSTVVAKSAGSKKGFLAYDNVEIHNGRVSKPLVYDPKFQRSPFDPFGRPSRVATLREIIKHRENMEYAAKESNFAENIDLPYGLWDEIQTQGDGISAARPTSRNLPRVTTTVEGKRLFECSSCGLAFGRLANLISHEKSHGFTLYSKYKAEPQVLNDDDNEECIRAYLKSTRAASSLSSLVVDDLNRHCH